MSGQLTPLVRLSTLAAVTVLSLASILAQVEAKATPRLGLSPTFNVTRIISSGKADCKEKRNIIDDCGLMQGFSFRFQEALYPTTHESLMEDCKRQKESLKCLKIYSKCLPALSEQVMLAMINNRISYNRDLCTKTPSNKSKRFLELNKCMQKSGLNLEKGVKAEENSIGFSESIINANSRLSDDHRLKYSCCSVARVKKEYMEATKPACSQHTDTLGQLVDSYLSDTVGFICPNFESSTSSEVCDKLPKLELPKQNKAKYFVRPIIDVINLLAKE